MKKIIYAFPVLLLLAFSGCAPLNFYNKLDPLLASGDYAGASALIDAEKKQYEGNHELLYYFDKGSVLQLLGQYSESSKMLDEAELLIDELYTRSVTTELGSFFSNDMNMPYAGEDFEQVMVHVIKALNFMAGKAPNFSGALVEARKADNRLKLLTDKYEGRNIYKEDALARYLSAFAYEAEGMLNDAYIDYKKSYEAYISYYSMYGTAVPDELKDDLLRLSEALGRTEDRAQYDAEFGSREYLKNSDLKRMGEVLVVVFDGMAPFKKSVYVDSPYYDGKSRHTYMVRVAFPNFVPRGYVVDTVEAEYKGVVHRGFVAEDITSIAVKNLQEKNALIAAKAIARAGVKYVAAQTISDGGKNKLLGTLANVYNAVSEQADTRSWRTLPARFHILRLRLKPGKTNLNININRMSGGSETVPLEINVRAGEKRVVPVFVPR
ncbi:MAG: hypothetical protein LLG37_07300 [Spirochaetia bacterium]|nr:hypothetical protein [Spirochaetia bacterium]